ncbi:MAG: hypothetical protein ACI8ZB_005484, partial [Desulforhopalus sp.]
MHKSLYNGWTLLPKRIQPKTEASMHHKNIKVSIRKQLKKQYPNWSSLPKKVKKHIIQEVIAE